MREALTRSLFKAAALVAVLSLVGAVYAQEEVEFEKVEEEPEMEMKSTDDPGPKISTSVGIKLLSERNSRGMILEDQGMDWQALLGVNVEIVENFSITSGVWLDIHSYNGGGGPSAEAAGAGTANTGLDSFYEFDWWIGFNLKVDKLNITAYYEEFLNPADDFASQTGGFESRHVQTVFTYDGLLDDVYGDIDLKPYVRILWEAAGKAGPGRDQGEYVEIGIAPSTQITDIDGVPITMTVPVTVGLGFDGFYEGNTHLGFVAVGVHFSMPLGFLSDYGSWSLSTGVDMIDGNDAAVGNFNTNVAGQTNDTRVIASIGLSGSF